jgi:hypothetical protein
MLELRIEAGYFCNTDRQLIRSIAMSAMVEAVLAGCDCILGDKLLLHTPSNLWSVPKTDRLLAAVDLVNTRILLIPRAIRLLREYSQTSDPVVYEDVVKSLSAVNDLPDAPLIMSMIASSSCVVSDASYPSTAPPYPLSQAFVFDSTTVLQLAVQFYMYKALRSNLALRCLDLGIIIPSPTAAFGPNAMTLQHESATAAENLIRCVPYSVSLDTAIPLGAIRMLKAMMVSWTCWDLQLDQTPYRSSASQHTRKQSGSSNSSQHSSRHPSRASSLDPELPITVGPLEQPGRKAPVDMFVWPPLRAMFESRVSSPTPPSTPPLMTLPIRPTSNDKAVHAVRMRTYCEEMSNYGLARWGGNELTPSNFARMRRVLMGVDEAPRRQESPAAMGSQAGHDAGMVYPRHYTPRAHYTPQAIMDEVMLQPISPMLAVA